MPELQDNRIALSEVIKARGTIVFTAGGAYVLPTRLIHILELNEKVPTRKAGIYFMKGNSLYHAHREISCTTAPKFLDPDTVLIKNLESPTTVITIKNKLLYKKLASTTAMQPNWLPKYCT